jgi:hypothetical protein
MEGSSYRLRSRDNALINKYPAVVLSRHPTLRQSKKLLTPQMTLTSHITDEIIAYILPTAMAYVGVENNTTLPHVAKATVILPRLGRINETLSTQ